MKFPTDVLNQIKTHLESEKEKIEKTLNSLASQDPFSDPDRLIDNAASDTEANEESSHERMEALEKELKSHLTEIKDALERIKKGSYGKCNNCHKMIDTDRLAIKPTAQFCVQCTKKREEK